MKRKENVSIIGCITNGDNQSGLKPEHLDCPLVLESSIKTPSPLFQAGEQLFPQKPVSGILGGSYHADIFIFLTYIIL